MNLLGLFLIVFHFLGAYGRAAVAPMPSTPGVPMETPTPQPTPKPVVRLLGEEWTKRIQGTIASAAETVSAKQRRRFKETNEAAIKTLNENGPFALALEYQGPEDKGRLSVLLSSEAIPKPAPSWRDEKLSLEEIARLWEFFIREGLFFRSFASRPVGLSGPHYVLSLRSNGEVLFSQTWLIEPGGHDRDGLIYPEIARKVMAIQSQLRGKSAELWEEVLMTLLPLRLSLRVEPTKVSVGGPVWVSGELKNVGKTKISIWDRPLVKGQNFCEWFDMLGQRLPTVWDEKNVMAPLVTEYFVLSPGESQTFRLNQAESLAKGLSPGDYKVRCAYGGRDVGYEFKKRTEKKVEYPWKGSVTSNTVLVEVR